MEEDTRLYLLNTTNPATYVSEEEFIRLVINVEAEKPSTDLFWFLFEVLADDDTTPSENPKIDFFYVFFRILFEYDTATAVSILKKLNIFMAKNKQSVKAFCCERNWILRLLQMVTRVDNQAILDEIIQVIQTLSQFSINTHELKVLFRMLCSESNSLRPRYYPMLLSILQNSVHKDGPDVYLDLSEKDACVHLPTIEKWPQNGYSLKIWFRVESFDDTSHTQQYKPNLCSFLTAEGFGLDIFFYNKALVVQTRLSKSKQALQNFNAFEFQEKTWYLLGVSHQYHFLRTSEVTVTVNGEAIGVLPLIYPKIEQAMTLCRLGSSASSGILQSFCGQIGQTIAFVEALTPPDIELIYSIGPNMTPVRDFEGTIVGQSGSTFVISNKHSCKILFSYDPKVVSAATLVETSSSNVIVHKEPKKSKFKKKEKAAPNPEQQTDNKPMTAQLMGQVVPVSSRPVDISLYCLGSVSVLFPLFMQLDYPIKATQSLQDAHLDMQSVAHKPPPQDLQSLAQILEFMANLLAKSTDLQNDMIECEGFSILGLMFQWFSPLNWTTEALLGIDKLATRIKNEYLCRQLITDILFNFRIWVRIPVELQDKVIAMITTHVKAHPGYFRQHVGVQRVLDIVRTYYFFRGEQEDHHSHNTSAFSGHHTTPAPSTPPTAATPIAPALHPQLALTAHSHAQPAVMHPSDIKALRLGLLRTVKLMVEEAPSADEVKSMVLYVLECPDHEQGLDVLQLLLAFLCTTKGQAVAEHVQAAGGFFSFLGFIARPVLALRLWAIKIFGKLWEHSKADRDRRFSRSANFNVNWPSSLKKALQAFELRESTYLALMEVLLERISPTSLTSVIKEGEEDVRTIMFKNPEFLAPIFDLLCASAQADIQRRALHDFSQLLSKNSTNREIFLQQSNWQNILLGFLVYVPPQEITHYATISQAQEENKEKKSEEIFGLVAEIYITLFLHLLVVKDGWKAFDQLQVLLRLYEDRGSFSANAVARAFNWALLSSLASDTIIVARSIRDPMLFENYAYWACFLEQNLFPTQINKSARTTIVATSDDPFLPTIFRGESGSWTDFHFAQKLLDFFDQITTGNPSNPPARTSQSSLPLPLPTILSSPTISNLVRLLLRVTLVMLYETDSVLHTERITKKKQYLNQVESSVTTNFGNVSARGIRAMAKYAQSRIKVWTGELERAEKIFATNIARLRSIINKYVRNDNDAGQLMYIVSFLYKALKRTQETKGVGGEQIMGLFQEILVSSKQRLLPKWSPVFTTMDDKVLVEMFKSFFANPDKPITELEQFGVVMKAFFATETQRETQLNDQLNNTKNSEKTRIEKETADEQNAQKRVEQNLNAQIANQSREEQERRAIVNRELRRAPKIFAKTWEKMYRDLSHERGPWYPPNQPEVFWKLDITENSLRMRVRLKRDRHHDPHHGCAKTTGTDSTASGGLLDDEVTNRLPPRLPQVHLRLSADSFGSDSPPPPSDTPNSPYRPASPFRPASPAPPSTPTTPGSPYIPPSPTTSTPTTSTSPSLTSTRPRGFSHSLSGSISPPPAPAVASAAASAPAPQQPTTIRPTPMVPLLPPSLTVPLQGSGEVGDLITADKALFSTECELVAPMAVVSGKMEISVNFIYFIADKHKDKEKSGSLDSNTAKRKDKKIAIWELQGIHLRRFILKASALEFFTVFKVSMFFNFPSGTRELVLKKILSLRPPSLVDYPSSGIVSLSAPTARDMFKKMNYTRRWVRREISNFEYLMHLNTLAGRTYNDLTQYPVFPWVIQDYTSPVLDLNNPATFRDLSKPVGALNPTRLNDFLERYEAFDDPEIPKFHYGSHYSSIGAVLYYLIRLEPFTTHFLKFQGGKFDHASRMFTSIPKCWEGCLANPSDVKELTPEFFYMPEFLENLNEFNLGFPNDDFGNVELPPWAPDPITFVRLNREALESEYVSNHLNEWIDLIFGFKQRGKEAVDAHNVFFYLTYEGSVDIDKITDPLVKDGILAQIYNFGQTPSQLLTAPHPKRMSLEELTLPSRSRAPSFISSYNPLPVNLSDSAPSTPDKAPTPRSTNTTPRTNTVEPVVDNNTPTTSNSTAKQAVTKKSPNKSFLDIFSLSGSDSTAAPSTPSATSSTNSNTTNTPRVESTNPFEGEFEPVKSASISDFNFIEPSVDTPTPATAAQPTPLSTIPENPLQQQPIPTTPPMPTHVNTQSVIPTSPTPVTTNSNNATSSATASNSGNNNSALNSSSNVPFCYAFNTNCNVNFVVFLKPPTSNTVILISPDLVLATITISPVPDGHGVPFTVDMDRSVANPKTQRRIPSVVPEAASAISNVHALCGDGKVLVGCGDSSNSIVYTNIATSKVIKRVTKHLGIVTCMAVDGDVLVTGSVDQTVLVWDTSYVTKSSSVVRTRSSKHEPEDPLFVLRGHDDAIQCVAVSIDMDIVVSGARDGTCIMHSLQTGKYLRSLTLSDSVDLVKISYYGDVVSYCATTGMLWAHTINGLLLGNDKVEPIDTFIFDKSGKWLITGSHAGGEGAVQIRQMLRGLPVVLRYNTECGVRALELVCEQKYLVVSLADGKLCVFECNL